MSTALESAIRVLIAGDDDKIRQVLRQVCEAEGGFAVVGEAEDGPQAVALAAILSAKAFHSTSPRRAPRRCAK